MDRITRRARRMSGRYAASRASPGVASTSAPSQRGAGRRSTCAPLRALRRGPSTPPPSYSDTWVDRFWLRQFHRQVALELGDDPSTATGEYDATMRRCVKLVSTSKTPLEAQQRGERVLRSLLPPGFEVGFRVFIASLPEWFVARHAAKVTPYLLPWLVGPSKVIDAPHNLPVDDAQPIPANAVYSALNGLKLEVAAAKIAAADANAAKYDGSLGSPSRDAASNVKKSYLPDEKTKNKPPGFADSGYQQGVLLERCRVLEESGCASVCLNVCKLPTQAFFNETVGLAVTLVPDYETFECRFVYGKTPPPPEQDEAFNTPCFSQCPISRDAGARSKPFLPDPSKNSSGVDSIDAAEGTAGASLCDRLPAYAGEKEDHRGGADGT